MGKITVKQEILEIPLASLNPFPGNPRDISAEAISGLRSSLEKFGYVDLIVVNKRNMEIIAGHQRYTVLKADGVESAPCIVVDVDDVVQRAMCISLNNQQISGFFTQALIPMLEQLRHEMPEDYISLRLQELREDFENFEEDVVGKTLPDDIPEAPKEAITKPGDLWILGEHRLLCGDSTNADHVARLMDGHQAQLMATDPPYLVDYTGSDRPNGGKDWSDTYHEIDIKDPERFFKDFLALGLAHTEQNAAIYMWHAASRMILIYKIFQDLGLLTHQHIVWVKPCSVFSFSIYPWRHEPCLFGWRKGFKPFFHPARKSIGSVWEINLLRSGDPQNPEYYSDIWQVDWDGKKRSAGVDHPTVKPTEIFAIPMRVHTKPGDVCYEPFSGSGSQIIAAERTNRRCFAMELEPVFCDVAVRRWEEFTGKKTERS